MPIESAPENKLVLTKISDAKGERNFQMLERRGRLWFAGNMYVYYAPTHWCEYAPPSPTGEG